MMRRGESIREVRLRRMTLEELRAHEDDVHVLMGIAFELYDLMRDRYGRREAQAWHRPACSHAEELLEIRFELERRGEEPARFGLERGQLVAA